MLCVVVLSSAFSVAAFRSGPARPMLASRPAAHRGVVASPTTVVRAAAPPDNDAAASSPVIDTTAVTTCACGSGLTYDECCGPLHRDPAARASAEPEAILRARYTAYVEKQPDFIMDTTHPTNEEYLDDKTAWRARILDFANAATFVDLSVLSLDRVSDEKELVTWTARMRILDALLDDRLVETKDFTERSIFVKEDDGRFYYVKGDPEFEPTVVTVDGPLKRKDAPGGVAKRILNKAKRSVPGRRSSSGTPSSSRR